MGRFLAGSIAALMLVAAGLFWWQGQAGEDRASLIAKPLVAAPGDELPGAGDVAAKGAAPPKLPQADNRTREQKRFDRYDRNRDGTVLRNEMMASRTAAFRKLDKDGNNLLSFEEWAVKTSDRFAAADANKDGRLLPGEFAATAPKPKPPGKQAICACPGADD
jgi:hypothetical protein